MPLSKMEKSDDYLKKAWKSFRELNIPGAYGYCINSLEEEPGNIKVYFLLRSVIQPVYIGHRNLFNREIMDRIIRKSLDRAPGEPVLYNFLGILAKFDRDYKKAREFFFRAVHLNRKAGNVSFHIDFLFDLAYSYKNLGYLDIFTRIALSMEWNLLLYKSTGQIALPREVFSDRLLRIEPDKPPVLVVRQAAANKDMMLMFHLDSNLFKSRDFINFLKVIKEHDVLFSFYHMISPGLIQRGMTDFLKMSDHFPGTPAQCPAAIYINGYTVHICQALRAGILPVIKRIKEPWNIQVARHPFCCC